MCMSVCIVDEILVVGTERVYMCKVMTDIKLVSLKYQFD